MRQMFLLISVLLLGMTWAVAQDTTQGSTSPSRGTNPMNSGQNAGTSTGGQKTVTGCLSGSSGSYTLTDKHGKSYQLAGDTAKLADHVGHEVKITGSSSSSGSDAGTTGASGSTAGTAGGGQTLEITSVKHISKTCQGGTGAMTH
jgi:hypothetical protein